MVNNEVKEMNKLYPVMLDLTGKQIVIVGGGTIALRKARGLEETGAVITIVSPTILDELKELSFITWKKKRFEKEDMKGAHFIFAATDNKEINKYIVECTSSLQFVNDISVRENSNFMTPAVMRRDKLVIAVSTSGTSPVLAKEIKNELIDYLSDNVEEKLKEYEKARKLKTDKL